MTATRGIAAMFLVAALVASRAHADPQLGRSVFGNGGGVSSGGGAQLLSTAGQPAVGASLGGGASACSGFWCNGGLTVVAVGPGPSEAKVPIVFAFSSATPNPTRGATTFSLALPRAGRVRLEAFDAAGRLIDAAVDRELAAGRYELRWDARSAAAGVYFARLLVDGQVRARRQLVVVH